MIPTHFEQVNFEFGKPSEMTDEQCMSLPVHKGFDQNGFPVIVSCWKLNYEELKLIQETGQIYLIITGTGMPPVSVAVENPFK